MTRCNVSQVSVLGMVEHTCQHDMASCGVPLRRQQLSKPPCLQDMGPSSRVQHSGVKLDRVIGPSPASFPPPSLMHFLHRSMHQFLSQYIGTWEHQRLSLGTKRSLLSPWGPPGKGGCGGNQPSSQRIRGSVRKLQPGRWDCACSYTDLPAPFPAARRRAVRAVGQVWRDQKSPAHVCSGSQSSPQYQMAPYHFC